MLHRIMASPFPAYPKTSTLKKKLDLGAKTAPRYCIRKEDLTQVEKTPKTLPHLYTVAPHPM